VQAPTLPSVGCRNSACRDHAPEVCAGTQASKSTSAISNGAFPASKTHCGGSFRCATRHEWTGHPAGRSWIVRPAPWITSETSSPAGHRTETCTQRFLRPLEPRATGETSRRCGHPAKLAGAPCAARTAQLTLAATEIDEPYLSALDTSIPGLPSLLMETGGPSSITTSAAPSNLIVTVAFVSYGSPLPFSGFHLYVAL
jgi:hypothetical protein